MGKSTISMAIFNSYVKLPEGNTGVTVFIRLQLTAGYFILSSCAGHLFSKNNPHIITQGNWYVQEFARPYPPNCHLHVCIYIYIMYLYIYIEREAGCKGFFLQFQTNPIDIPLYPQDWFGYPSVRSHTTAHCSRENTMGAPSLWRMTRPGTWDLAMKWREDDFIWPEQAEADTYIYAYIYI